MIAGHNDLLDEITWHAKFDCPRTSKTCWPPTSYYREKWDGKRKSQNKLWSFF